MKIKQNLEFVQPKGFAPLAARPAPTLPTSSFAFIVYRHTNTVRQSVLLPQNGSHPQIPSLLGSHTNKKRHPRKGVFFVGADEGIRTHTVAHRNLKPARLPVPPHPHIKERLAKHSLFLSFLTLRLRFPKAKPYRRWKYYL